MGGRGASSGIKKSSGFEYQGQDGRQVRLQMTKTGVILVNGKPDKRMTQQSYKKIYEAQKGKTGFKNLSSRDLEKQRTDRYTNFNSHDYELIETGKQRGKVYRPRRRK